MVEITSIQMDCAAKTNLVLIALVFAFYFFGMLKGPCSSVRDVRSDSATVVDAPGTVESSLGEKRGSNVFSRA